MKWTNKLGLPKRFVNAVINDPYSKGDADFSITELLKPPRVRVLFDRHDEEIVQDVSDFVARLLGKGVHEMLEKSGGEGLAEKRYTIQLGDYTVSGGVDLDLLLEEGKLYDWKTTKVYKIIKRDFFEWAAQMNGYAMLLKSVGKEVGGLTVVPFITDWLYRDSLTKKDYPKTQTMMIDLPLWDDATTREFFLERIALHRSAERALPECTREETWNGVRCDRWCAANVFCTQYQGVKNAK